MTNSAVAWVHPRKGSYLVTPIVVGDLLWGCGSDGIVTCFLELLSRHPDSLIARKCGGEVASEASRRAREVLDAGWPRTEVGATALRDLDRWLRDDDHRRNPGATADVTAGVLFLAMRGGIIPVGDGSESSAPVDARDR